jgi:hypothetical protein
MYFWAYDGQHLIYMQDTDGDENFHCYAVNITTNDTRNITPHEGVKAQPIELDPDFPDEILMGMNLQDPQKFDVYRSGGDNAAITQTG